MHFGPCRGIAIVSQGSWEGKRGESTYAGEIWSRNAREDLVLIILGREWWQHEKWPAKILPPKGHRSCVSKDSSSLFLRNIGRQMVYV